AYSERRKQLEYELQWLEREVGETRAKTAPIPDQAPRKEWQPDSVQIKTNKGSKVKVKAPGLLSGNYSEDFDAMDGGDDEDAVNSFEEDLDNYLNSSEELCLEDDDDDDDDELTLSMNDVETLRKSLEADQSIQKSIKAAQERIQNEEETGRVKTDDDNEDEEIEEELEGASNSLNLAEIDKLPHFTPTSTSKSIEIEEDKPISDNRNKQSISFQIPLNDESDKECAPILKEKTFVKEPAVKQGRSREYNNEDLVVLSFSSSSITYDIISILYSRRKQDAVTLIASSIPAKEHHIKQHEYTSRSSKSKDSQVELKSSQKTRTRPLSASRKKRSTEHIPEDSNAEEIFKAMALENQTVVGCHDFSVYYLLETASGFHTAPENRQADAIMAVPEQLAPRPASIASTSEKTISRVTQKVRSMDPRQQHHLISLLSKLELKDPPFKAASPALSSRKGSPMKATIPYSSAQQSLISEANSSLVSCPGTQSVEPSRPGLQEEAAVDVNIEIQSNWGHPNTLGITEVQFYGGEGCVLKYDTNNVSVSGYFGDQGVLANLANAKTKTNKSKYMWWCQFIPGSPVELMFHLPVNHSNLSKIVIWNFNGGVRDLNMGVKDVRIFIGCELAWRGTIDKGCGNQVFDYSTVINLSELEKNINESIEQKVQPAMRSETVVIKKSSEGKHQNVGNLPIVSIPSVAKDFTSSRNKSNVPESLLPNKVLDSTEGRLVTRSSSTPNLSSNFGSSLETSEDDLRGNSAALPSKPPWLMSTRKKSQSRSRSSSRSKSRPIWLQEKEDDGCRSPKRSLSSTEVRLPESPTPPGEGTMRCRSTGARCYSLPGKQDSDQWPSDFASRKEEVLPTCLDSSGVMMVREKRKSESRHSRQNVRTSTPLTQPSDHVEKPCPSGDEQPKQSLLSKRQQWRMEQSLSLEESWNVLSMFEKSHKGRITNNMDLECQDDALDQFLSSEVNQPESRKEQIPDQTDYRPMDEGLIQRSQEIPTLPKGKRLVINIMTTWGDRHYVGLNGVEIYTEYGKPANIQEIAAHPSDINILADYGSDPRVVTNLMDGIFRTRDDMHLWMAPFTPTENHYIYVTFTETIRIAMIRIWNYNKSRIHSYRGAKDIEITLDDDLIFEGEIQRASGTLGQDEPFGDTILFTMDEQILDAMSLYDQTYEIPDDEDSLIYSQEYKRPSTADREDDNEDNEDRPFTCARQRKTTDEEDEEHTGMYRLLWCDCGHSLTDEDETVEEAIDDGIIYGQVLELCFVATWGDPYYMGLTGLELFGPTTIPVSYSMMEAHPRDLNDLSNYDDDDRTLDKIIDGINVTTSDEHMWLIPFTEGEDHTLSIDLGNRTQLMGMRVWNYNKSPDDTFRGAKLVHVKLDGCVLSPTEGYLLRKGPGNMYFDFAQDIYFVKSAAPCLRHAAQEDVPDRRPGSRVNIKKLIPDYEPTLMPTGFVFQFQLLSSWGDPYYIGLNGIQFYDEDGYRIYLTENNVTAHPHSVNVLDGVTADVRTPDKLIDGVNDTTDGRHMWLSPICPGQVNLIFVIFDEPVTVSMVKIWNYSKTPIRGVQHFVLSVDDLLVYDGILPQVPSGSAILPNLDLPVPHHTVLFTDREQIALAERKNVVRSIDLEQDVQLTNDKRVVTSYADPKSTGKTADP
ncbi:hypothetical protein QZH41_019340, partial [Actinostola sp. cb2023]